MTDPDSLRRIQLQSLLESLIGDQGNVYFQPPSNMTMQFPCIVYQRDSEDLKFADNDHYRRTKRYQVTVIDRNPDSDIPDKVAALPLCRFSRHFTADNLNHDVYNIFF